MIVKELLRHINNLEELRHDLNVFYDSHPDIMDEFEDIYLRIIRVIVDYENVIKRLIAKAEVNLYD